MARLRSGHLKAHARAGYETVVRRSDDPRRRCSVRNGGRHQKGNQREGAHVGISRADQINLCLGVAMRIGSGPHVGGCPASDKPCMRSCVWARSVTSEERGVFERPAGVPADRSEDCSLPRGLRTVTSEQRVPSGVGHPADREPGPGRCQRVMRRAGRVRRLASERTALSDRSRLGQGLPKRFH